VPTHYGCAQTANLRWTVDKSEGDLEAARFVVDLVFLRCNALPRSLVAPVFKEFVVTQSNLPHALTTCGLLVIVMAWFVHGLSSPGS